MARTESIITAASRQNRAQAHIWDDAASPVAASIKLGFQPSYIKVVNITDRITNEWYAGMTSAHAVHTVAAGTRTLATSGGPTVVDDTIGFVVAQSKHYHVIAE